VSVGGGLLAGWLLAALALLAMDGRLPAFVLAAVPGSLLVLAVRALVRQQRRPSALDGLPLPERYRVADDLRAPLCAVVAAAEREAMTAVAGPERQR
jgi:hypothetical protein